MARELGVRKLTFFPHNGTTYQAPVSITNTVALNTTNVYKEISYNSDCKTEFASSSLQNVEVELELSTSIKLEELSKITAMEYIDGKLVNKIDSAPKNGALAYEILMDNGNIRRRVLYMLNLKRDTYENETDSEGQTMTLTGVAVPATFTVNTQVGEYTDLTMDLAEINAIADEPTKTKALGLFNNFFTAIVTPDK